MVFEISAAVKGEERAIFNLISESVVSSDSKEKTGLIDYKPVFEKISKRCLNGNFLVTKQENKIVAVLDFYLRKELNSEFPNDSLIQKIINLESEDFIYLNTLAVDSNFRRIGLAEGLIKKAENLFPSKKLLAAIVHKPLNNLYSVNLFKKNGL